jgi:RNA polymerase sigma-70 factor, ECF subfamily
MVESSPFFTPVLTTPTTGAEDPPVQVVVPPSIQRIMEVHADFVWRSLRRLGVPENLVEDSAQQVFAVFARKVDQVRPGSERAFLFGTLTNIAAHARRSLARNREQPYEDAHALVDPSPPPDELASQRQSRALLDQVLDALPLDLRTVFVLFELEELSAPQIAELTGLPVGTVASRMRRAREEFQRAAKRVRAHAMQCSRGKP